MRVQVSLSTAAADAWSCVQISKLPAEVQKEKAREAIRANEIAKKDAQLLNDGKTRMKGKNVATKRHRKRQNNIIEVRCCYLVSGG